MCCNLRRPSEKQTPNNHKGWPRVETCLDHDNLSLSIKLMQVCNRGASRLGEARQGLDEATHRTQNVLAQGQSEAHVDSKPYNAIVEVPARLNLKQLVPVLPHYDFEL